MVGVDALSKVIFIYSFTVVPASEYSTLASTTLLSPEVNNCAFSNDRKLTLLSAIINPKSPSGATLKVAGAIPYSASDSDIPFKVKAVRVRVPVNIASPTVAELPEAVGILEIPPSLPVLSSFLQLIANRIINDKSIIIIYLDFIVKSSFKKFLFITKQGFLIFLVCLTKLQYF